MPSETKEKKPKQEKIPGFTELEDDKVEALAEQYRDQTDEWLAAQKPALETEKALQAACEANKKIMAAANAHPKHKVKVGGFVLTITAKDPTLKVGVKKVDEDGE